MKRSRPWQRFTKVIGERQLRVLRLIDGYRNATDGCSPTIAFLSANLGIVPSSVHRDVLGLEEAGLLTRKAGLARTIVLTEAGKKLARKDQESAISTQVQCHQ